MAQAASSLHQSYAADFRSDLYACFAQAFRGNLEDEALNTKLSLPPLTTEEKISAFVTSFEPAVSDEACSLFEGAYAKRERSAVFEDLVRFYDYFGLARKATADLPDHIAVELEFMHFLSYLEYEAEARGEDFDGLRRAQSDFLTRHLVPFVQNIHAENQSPTPTLKALTASLAEFVQNDAKHLAQI